MKLINEDQYWVYGELIKNGTMTIETKDIDESNLNKHFNSIINILSDGIEKKEVQSLLIHIIFTDNIDVDLSLFDYIFNLIFWTLPVKVKEPIDSSKIFFAEDLTKKEIKNYIDKVFIKKYRTIIPFKQLNNYIDDIFGKFRLLSKFQMFLANTVCLEDTIDLMNKYPEFNETIHLDLANVPIEDVKDKGMEATNVQIKYIKNSDHCLRDSFRSGEAISPKQYKEVQVSIGSKPDGQGGVYPSIINNSFINGGLNTPEAACIESSVGRIAQILQKTNVGSSGAFARILGLNNIDTRLHDDPHYSCNTKNFEEVLIKNDTILSMYDMRYYRWTKTGDDYLLDADIDKHLIGQKLYFRSPMTCASKARGEGVCYKCYGDLAYVNKDINIGKIAAELLSSIYTQILLSAKHLLESLVVKMNWAGCFSEYFDINFNTIQLKQDVDMKDCYIIINQDDIQVEDDMDELDFNEYITNIDIKLPDGTISSIHTSESDSIYIHSDMLNRVKKLLDKVEDDSSIEIPLESLKDIQIMFVMHIRNNELSRTMNMVKNIINNKVTTKKFNRNTILETFIDTNLEGGIKLNAVHFEILLSNQIRSVENIVLDPDWSEDDEDCQLLTLNEALTNNQSITVRLEYSRISKTLYNPASFKISKPSNIDLYFMPQPQEFIHDDSIVSDKYTLINDIEKNKIEPFHFTK